MYVCVCLFWNSCLRFTPKGPVTHGLKKFPTNLIPSLLSSHSPINSGESNCSDNYVVIDAFHAIHYNDINYDSNWSIIPVVIATIYFVGHICHHVPHYYFNPKRCCFIASESNAHIGTICDAVIRAVSIATGNSYHSPAHNVTWRQQNVFGKIKGLGKSFKIGCWKPGFLLIQLYLNILLIRTTSFDCVDDWDMYFFTCLHLDARRMDMWLPVGNFQ